MKCLIYRINLHLICMLEFTKIAFVIYDPFENFEATQKVLSYYIYYWNSLQHNFPAKPDYFYIIWFFYVI